MTDVQDKLTGMFTCPTTSLILCNLPYVRHFYDSQKACPHGQKVHSHGQNLSTPNSRVLFLYRNDAYPP